MRILKHMHGKQFLENKDFAYGRIFRILPKKEKNTQSNHCESLGKR